MLEMVYMSASDSQQKNVWKINMIKVMVIQKKSYRIFVEKTFGQMIATADQSASRWNYPHPG